MLKEQFRFSQTLSDGGDWMLLHPKSPLNPSLGNRDSKNRTRFLGGSKGDLFRCAKRPPGRRESRENRDGSFWMFPINQTVVGS